MGKKSKRKSTNKLTPCYHGCITKKDFNFGGHYKTLEGWDDDGYEDADEFFKTQKRVLNNPTFGCFVAAQVTADFLKGKNIDIVERRLLLLISMRYVLIPENEGKDIGPNSEYIKNYHKYYRDIKTERGRINCMAREIPCKCMEEKRIAAKSMEKLAICFGCREGFLKEKMLRCEGCDHVQYCSNECQTKNWPTHKKYCSKYNVSSATASTSASVPSSFEKPSDVDVEEK